MNAFFLKSIRPYFNFPGLSLPAALNSGLWLDEKIEAMQHISGGSGGLSGALPADKTY
jgi:hypothetical protein